MKDVTRDEINDAMQRFIADGGEIEKIKITIPNPIFNRLWIENFIKFSEFI